MQNDPCLQCKIFDAVQNNASHFAQLSSLVAALAFASIIIIVSSEYKNKRDRDISNSLITMLSSLFLMLVSAFSYTMTTSNIWPITAFFSILVAHYIFSVSVVSVFLAVFWLIYSYRETKRSFQMYFFIFLSVNILVVINITTGSYNLLSVIGHDIDKITIVIHSTILLFSIFIGIALRRIDLLKQIQNKIITIISIYSILYVFLISSILGIYYYDLWSKPEMPPFWSIYFFLAALSVFITLAQIAAPHLTSQDPHSEER